MSISSSLSRFRLGTKHIRMLVLDEADEMLCEGFKEQIYNIFVLMPENVQVPCERFLESVLATFDLLLDHSPVRDDDQGCAQRHDQIHE